MPYSKLGIQDTYEQIKSDLAFSFKSPGRIEVKGKG